MITKREFYEYIESFGKLPGEYTDEEVFKICEAHKDLISGKSWSEVVSLLGVNKSPEALRSWTYRQEEDKGLVRRNVDMLSEKTVSELNQNEIDEKISEQLGKLYVEKTKVRDSYTAYRRTLRDEARIESMLDSIKAAASGLVELPRITFNEKDDVSVRSEEAILCVSDLHIGVDCDNFYNKYNVSVAATRLSKLALNTVKYCNLHGVKTLHVINLGDMIHGLIHTSARLEQELDVTEQIMQAAELLAQFLNIIQRAAPTVTYRSVVDNHSRAIANYKEHIEKENFSKLIDWFLEYRLGDTNIKFMHDNLDDGIGMFTLSNGKKVMFAHGHQDGRNNSMQNMIGLTQEWVDYILLAHYHNSATKEFQACKVFINGSIVGTEQYAFGKRLFSKPSQKLIIFGESSVSDIDISLE